MNFSCSGNLDCTGDSKLRKEHEDKNPFRRKISYLFDLPVPEILKQPSSTHEKEIHRVQLTEHPKEGESSSLDSLGAPLVWDSTKRVLLWLVLDSPSHGWVTTEEESQILSKWQRRLPGTLASSPANGNLNFLNLLFSNLFL